MTRIDNHYVDPRLVELYDVDSPWSPDREFYLDLATADHLNILDLGCGTGLLCDAYAAKGHRVTGLDPSNAMLDVARRKPHGDKIEWVQTTAQNYQSDKLFDLIVMTGHAFQVLLTDEDILSAFSVMRAQLGEGGLIVFESRNPRIDWSKTWDYDMELHLPDCIVTESRRLKRYSADRMSFDLIYEFPQETLVSASELRFLSKDTIAKHLADAKLSLSEIIGDYNGSRFDESTSEEMIFKVTKP